MVWLRTFGRDTLAEIQIRFCLFCVTTNAGRVKFLKTIIKLQAVLYVKYTELPTSKAIVLVFPHYAVFHDMHHRCEYIEASNKKRKFTSENVTASISMFNAKTNQKY